MNFISVGNNVVSSAIREKHALMSFPKTNKIRFSKTHECMFFPNFTRNHTIT